MRSLKGNISSKILSTFVLLVFLTSNLTVAEGIELSDQTISPSWIIAEAPSPEREAFQKEVMSHWMYNYVFLAISKFFLEERSGEDELRDFLRKELSGRKEDIRDMYVFINEVTITNGKVRMPFRKDNKRGVAEIWRSPSDEDQRFIVEIRPDEINDAVVAPGSQREQRFSLVGKIIASLSLEGLIPEFIKKLAAIAANMKGGLGVYFADKLSGLAGIGATGMGFQCGYKFGTVDGKEETV
ncbi:MAG: hypothetical protein KKG84_06180, partial [Candidatus Omnitrophica bacterium]|nr:hypothetical protein [Candidatus Omnitrophota bacterium]